MEGRPPNIRESSFNSQKVILTKVHMYRNGYYFMATVLEQVRCHFLENTLHCSHISRHLGLCLHPICPHQHVINFDSVFGKRVVPMQEFWENRGNPDYSHIDCFMVDIENCIFLKRGKLYLPKSVQFSIETSISPSI